MVLKKRVEALEEKTGVSGVSGEEIVFETQTCRDIQARLKAEGKPTKRFNLQAIQKKMSAIS